MLENRNLRGDLLALVLLVVVVFLAMSLVTYDPADPVPELPESISQFFSSDTVVYPVNEEIANAGGRWGVLTANLLLNALGLGAYYLVVSLGVLSYFLLRRHAVDTPTVRMAGWLASLVGIAAMATIIAPGLSPGPVVGSGGYLGALAQGILELHFATAGSVILATSLILGGLLLCTDYALLKIAGMLFRLVFVGASRPLRRTAKRRQDKPAKKRRAEIYEDFDEEDDEEDEADNLVSIKFRSRKLVEAEPDDWDGLDEETGEEADDLALEESVDEIIQPPVVKRRKNARADGEHAPKTLLSRRKRAERDVVREQLDEASAHDEPLDYALPEIDLLTPSEEFCFDEQEKECRRKAKILEKTFADFGFRVRIVEIETGPVIAQYEVELEAGLRLSKITGLADDLAIALRVPSVRIVAPIPGKNTVGIEVPNEQRQMVRLREVIEEADNKTQKMRIPLFLGKDVSGKPLVVDLSTLPHLLIAGRTGTGKSVCLNAIISSILMTRRPDEVRMLMIDPKMVELSCYGRLPHLMHPVVTDMRKAEAILAWAVDKMEERYSLLAKAGVRHISSYNQLDEEELMSRLEPETEEERASIPLHLPFIVIVADEMADLMMTAGKEAEQHIIRLAQKSRAVGIHLILATQKPTVDVITGLIKSNLPARISFQVASRTDSRVVLDEMGADKLLGHGDMLFLSPGTSSLMRGQGTFLSDEEIDAVVDCVSTGEPNYVHELVNLKVEDKDGEGAIGKLKKRDDLYENAIDIVVREGRGSVSLLQRSLGIGYGRAARLIDFMAEDSIVGAYAGSQAREVLISAADWQRMQSGEEPEAEEPPRRSRKVSLRAKQPVVDELEDEEQSDYFAEEDEGYEDAYEEADEPAEFATRLRR